MKLRFLSTRIHGVMDYVVAPLLPIFPRLMGFGEPVKRIFDETAAAAGANTLYTNFEAGLIKAIPVKAHLAMDGASAAIFFTAAALKRGQRRESISLTIAGLYFLATSILTETSTSQEKLHLEQQRQRAMVRHKVQTPVEEYARQTRPESAIPS